MPTTTRPSRATPPVAVVTDLWPSRSQPLGGIFVHAQVRSLANRVRQVVLVPQAILPSLHRRIWGEGVNGWQRGYVALEPPHQVLRYPMLRVPKGGETAARTLGASLALRLARERPALVHGHFLFGVGPAALRLGRRLRLPTVLTAHGTDARWLHDGPSDDRFRQEAVAAAVGADAVVAVSGDVAGLLRAAGVPGERIHVVPMGVDERGFRILDRAGARRALGLDEERPLVLYVGRVDPAKGVDVLAQACAELERGGLPVACFAAGPPGEERPGLRQLGPVQPERLPLWLNAADVLCLPSFAEGSPVSVVEALACGTPVVATAVGGVPAQVTHGENGELVQPGDAGELAAALARVLARDWNRERLRETSSAFWWSALSARLLRLYDELLER